MGKYEGITDKWNEFKDQKEQWENLQDAIPDYDLPPDDLYNIPGTDVWVTPNEPVEPGDCEKWPASCESIFNPLDPQGNHSLSPGIDISTTESTCSLCMTFTPNIGPISLPPYTICRIKEECEEPVEEEELLEEELYIDEPEYYEYPVRNYPWFLVVNGGVGDGTFCGGDSNIPPPNLTATAYDYEFNCGSTYYDLYGMELYINVPAGARLRLKKIGGYQSFLPPIPNDAPGYTTWGFRSYGFSFYFYLRQPGALEEFITYPKRTISGSGTVSFKDAAIKGFTYNYIYLTTDRERGSKTINGSFKLNMSEEGVPIYPPTTPSPTKIPTPSPQIMPTCCDLEPVLKAVKKLQKSCDRLEKVIAPEEFYKVKNDGTLSTNIASIPKRFIFPLASGSQPVTNYAKMLEYLMRQIDRHFGPDSWEVTIKDSDPNTPGDQTLPIQVHSTNDGLKAIFQFLIDQATDKQSPQKVILENVLHNQKALIHIGFDLASTKKLAFHNNKFLQNIEDHLDYKVKQVELDVGFAINPKMNGAYTDQWKNDKVIRNLFQVKDHKIVVTDNIDKVGLPETLNQISRNAAIAASPHVYRYKPGVIDKLVDAAQLGAELTNTALILDLKKHLGIMNKNEMEEWEKDAEKAYIPSGGNLEDSIEVTGSREEKYYGHKKPAQIKNSTKRSRRRNRRQ